jgi:hypothetical protein
LGEWRGEGRGESRREERREKRIVKSLPLRREGVPTILKGGVELGLPEGPKRTFPKEAYQLPLWV